MTSMRDYIVSKKVQSILNENDGVSKEQFRDAFQSLGVDTRS